MNTKKLAILIVFTTLLIFSVVSRIFFNDFQDGWNAYENKDYETARKLWTPLAEQGDSKAQFFLGFMHDMGFGVPEDDQEAIKWYQLAAEQGNSRAQLFTGFAYDYGRGVPEDDQEALKWYQLAEKQGYYQARANIVKLEELVEKNVPQALKGLIDDAEKGIAEAQYTLGVMYANGQGVSQNHKEAAKWYGLAAAQGYTAKTNIYNLAKKNVPQALKVLMGDAEKGIVDAQYTLGMMYANGQGVPQDYKEAVKWYKLAANRGSRQAKTKIYDLAVKSIPQALQALIDDAENGVAEAQINLAIMREFGLVVSQDNQEALKWYQLIAEKEYHQAGTDVLKSAIQKDPEEVEKIILDANKGIAKAQYTLGMMYANGQGVPQDQKEARKFYRLAAKQGYQAKINIYNLAKKNVPQALKVLIDDAEKGIVDAQSTLGMMYANGQGVPQDHKEAFKWYRLVAEQGTALEETTEDKLKKKNIPQALKFLTNDAENGVVDAQIDLGVMYANGQYVPQDDRQSAKWYRLAAENGDSRAQIILSVMYAKGQGVPQSDQKAVKWLRFSMKERVAPEKTHIYNLAKKNVSSAIKILIDDAENGVVEAQNYLGTMYANGQGVPRDYVLAHMWYNLSGLQGHKAATAQINLVERKMSPEQIEKAQEMVRDWTPRK
ncbi:MAG: sel1 repeat family protein [Nitrospinae bacterium]|nr:sel1 repeat family protein [Nitrospinota bacterium]MBL7019576.1 sel1 repeat family protein [Nitrospinaceae bacterium]